MAIMAGFEHCRGEIIVTLDADLQNPPEEIGKLIAKMREGHDYVGSIRRKRQDSLFRTWASKAMNRPARDDHAHQDHRPGQHAARLFAQRGECHQPAGGQHLHSGAGLHLRPHPTEVMVEHAERAAGESKYSLYSLIRLNFDLMTGFSLVPLQWFSMLGIVVSWARRRCSSC
jgi:undecaprenyl-phosphate 4-deoxy-4-formamido-L-arabinose transferase